MSSKSKSKSLQPKKITGKKDAAESTPSLPKLPPELEEKLNSLKKKLDSFKEKVLEKFGDYIVGITVLPPEASKEAQKLEEGKEGKESKEIPAEKEAEKKEEPKISVLVVVDDTTSKKMTKDELHDKFSNVVKTIAEETDKEIKPQSVLLTDIWQGCYDGKFDLNRLVSMGYAIYDNGMLAAIKIAEIHKSMVIKKFDRYILSYVLAGSLTQGRATATSDIDVWIVIDDTDVKKMSRL